MAVITILPGAHHVWTDGDVREAYSYLAKQSPRNIANLLVDWRRPIDNGCTPIVEAESMGMSTIIANYLYNRVSLSFLQEVVNELMEIGRDDIINLHEFILKYI